MSIDWQAFDWQSFATLAAGLSAVAGATIVGFRQAGIAERQATIAESQNAILHRQAALAEVALRHELFERRYGIYDATRNFLGSIVQHADRPAAEIMNSFMVAMNESRFLFRPGVHDALREIWKRATTYFALKAEMNHIYMKEQHYGDGNAQKEYDLLVAIEANLSGLVDLFGEEMQLSYDALVGAERSAEPTLVSPSPPKH